LEITMKNIFKSTLIAAAVATVCSTAYAGNTEVTTQTYSQEGVSAVTTAQTTASISYLTKAAYAVGDKVTFTFTTGSLDTTNAFPSQIAVAADATVGSEKAGMALGLLNETATSVTYRVTSLTQPGVFTDKTTLGQTITLGAVKLKATAVAAGDTTVTVDSQTSAGDTLDSSSDTGKSRTGKMTQVKTQYGAIKVASTAMLDGTIDVAAGRKALLTANDAMSFTVSNPVTTGWLNLVTTTGTVVVMDGDLAGFANTNVATGLTSTVKYDDSKKQTTITYAGTEVTTDTITITPPTGTKAVILTAQDFKVTGTYTYGTASTAALGSAAAGTWNLNGAVVNVPYMPYGPNISQIIYVTNTGSLDGDVSVTAFDEAGTTYDLGVVTSAKAGTVTKLASVINTALEAQGFKSGKLSMTITVNAQDKDITVQAAYNVGGADRGSVMTSQYKN
jgi:hypothetical protein